MERRPVVIANWKMELSHKASTEAANAIKKLLKDVKVDIDIVICPSYTVLEDVKQVIAQSEKLQLGAQNVHWEENGPYTGEVSVTQLTPLVKWCIVGHSEQRALTGETDEIVQHKADLLLQHGIAPIICIGETLEERQADQTVEKLTRQMSVLLGKATRVALTKMVIAYEPIWAIGAAQTPEPDDIAGSMLLLRKLTAERFGNEVAQRLRIVYGGSVTPKNIGSIMAEPGIDGALVGGASLHPMDFVEIIKAVQAAQQ